MDPFDPADWKRIEPILDAALEAPESERARVLEEVCGGDAGLRAVVERLLEATGEGPGTAPDALDRPAAVGAAELLEPPRGPGPRPGDVVAGYEIRDLVGRGGMGEVYRAHHPTLDRDVALKLLPPRSTGSAEARERLIREARAASRLDHPNVQTVYDAGETGDGDVFLALAYYDGESLAKRLARVGPLPPDEVQEMGRQLAAGLAAAHAAGVIHRDVKPSNLLVLADGRLKIVDFGIAHLSGQDLTRDGPAYGTIAYMSPEQTRGEPADERSDVWSTGVVLYEALTGRRPFRGANDRALIHAIRHDDPPPVPELRPDVPWPLAEAIERCLRKYPDDRFTEAGLLRDTLGRGGPRAAGPPPARTESRDRTSPGARSAIAAAALLALVVLAASWFGRGPAGEAGDAGEVGGAASAADVHPAAARMTILPFLPVPGDSALERLGRQLAVTVSTNLDGVGPIRTTEGLTVLMGAGEGESAAGAGAAPMTLERARDLARRFAATSYLRGTLLRTGDRLRVDAALHDVRTDAEIGRFAVTGPREDITALTDSITLGVLAGVWRAGDIPAPSLVGVTTRSVPALRAYLDGELALAAGRFDEAIRAFEASFAADSTFWFALWRSLYPRAYESWADLEPELYRRLYANRHELPESARLIMESERTEGLSPMLAAKREITRRFPSYWPGWWSYANTLVHFGPLAGRRPEEARAALERTLGLHPTFLPAWEHLLWIAVQQRDTARAGEALARLEAAGRAGNPRLAGGLLPLYRTLHAGLRGPAALEPELRRKAEDVAGREGPIAPFFAVDLLVLGGMFEAQERVNEAVLAAGRTGRPGGARRPSAELIDLHRLSRGLARAGRGAWDEGLALASEAPLPGLDSVAPLAVYGLAVVGAWLGEVAPDVAATFRPSDEPSGEAGAERLWLDGLLAFATGRPAVLDAAAAALERHRTPHAGRLAQSLVALRTALVGDSVLAGRRLAELEEEGAGSLAFHGYGGPHPWLTAVNRLAAARWLAAAGEAGDTARAERLLGWEDAVLQQRHYLMGPVGVVVGTRALPLRARLAAARGDTTRAGFLYRTFLDRVDRPAGPVRRLAAEAREGVSAR